MILCMALRVFYHGHSHLSHARIYTSFLQPRFRIECGNVLRNPYTYIKVDFAKPKTQGNRSSGIVQAAGIGYKT